MTDPVTFNPYAAPKAQVDDVSILRAGEPVFFPVGRLKLTLMTLATFNLYVIYWFYRNWKHLQKLTGKQVSAVLRSVFYALTAYFLFRGMRRQADAMDVVFPPAGLLALVVLALASLWRLPDPWWLITFLGFLPLLPVQSAVNDMNRKAAPDADPNDRFRGSNVAVLLVGGLLFVMAVLGAFLEA
jgi:hypothetical protein